MELRKDYTLERWVIIARNRSKRPVEVKKQAARARARKQDKACVFCPGNESQTPGEIGRVGVRTWKVRWFPNKFPAVDPEPGTPPPSAGTAGFLRKEEVFGYHEIIVETPRHDRQLAELSASEIAAVLEVYAMRIKELKAQPGIRYVCVFKNSGYESGTSLIHSHSQVIALSAMPPLVRAEVAASQQFQKEKGVCPYCAALKEERQSARFIYENSDFIALAPYASRFNYEAWILPKAHVRTLEEMEEEKLKKLADVLRRLLRPVGKMRLPYNILLHYSPSDADLHLHLELCPRSAIAGGFEYLSDITINTVPPEEAAAVYRK